MKGYRAVLFSPDGEWVLVRPIFRTVDECREHLDNLGSTFVFYPLAVYVHPTSQTVQSTRARVIDGEPYEDDAGRFVDMSRFVGRTLCYVSQRLASGE